MCLRAKAYSNFSSTVSPVDFGAGGLDAGAAAAGAAGAGDGGETVAAAVAEGPPLTVAGARLGGGLPMTGTVLADVAGNGAALVAGSAAGVGAVSAGAGGGGSAAATG